MQTGFEGPTFAAENSIKSGVKPEAVYRLIAEIQPLIAPLGISSEILVETIKEALLEIGDKNNSADELRSSLLGLILWKIFARGSALWIGSQTQSGNKVSLDLRVAAYAMWESALRLAKSYGVDAAGAADALVHATYATANRIAENDLDPKGERIRDLRKYTFKSYFHLISGMSAKHGSRQTDYVDMEEWVANREFSDRGAFLNALESGVLCREILKAMPPKGRSVAIARYVLGYSWPETADSLGTSINAAQKALSSGIKNALGMCMRELRKMGYQKVAEVENHLMKNKKTRFLR